MNELAGLNINNLATQRQECRASGEISLWRSVIAQSLDDLKLPITNKKYHLWSRQAMKWFISADSDFFMVCDLASVSAHSILQQAHHLIQIRKLLPKNKKLI